jgi:hypothetical protein
MNRYKSYGKGWHYESHRHSLAAKGIKTRLSFAETVDPNREKKIRDFIRYQKGLPPALPGMKDRSAYRAQLTDYPIGSWEREAMARLIAELELEKKKSGEGVSGPSTHRTDVIVLGGKEVKDDQGIIHRVPGKAIPKKRIMQFYNDYIKKELMSKKVLADKDKVAEIRKLMIEQGKQMTKNAKGAPLTVDEEAEIEQNVDERINAARLQFDKVMDDVKAIEGWFDEVDVTSDTFEDQLKDAQAKMDTVMDQRGTIIPGQEVLRLRAKVEDLRERRLAYKRGIPEKWPPEQ